jgi:hypothetical protein
MRLADLNFPPSLLAELQQHGFDTVEQMSHLPNSYILRIPGMGGSWYRRLAAAMGREAYAKSARKLSRPKEPMTSCLKRRQAACPMPVGPSGRPRSQRP